MAGFHIKLLYWSLLASRFEREKMLNALYIAASYKLKVDYTADVLNISYNQQISGHIKFISEIKPYIK
jgi:hypothetical protein